MATVLELIKQAAIDKSTQLDLYGNQLTSLPPEIVQLTSLQQLYLGGNQLPDSITSLLKRGVEDLLTYLRSVADVARRPKSTG